MAFKTQIARAALRWKLSRFLRDANPFNRLMGHAVRLQLGKTTEEQFRLELDDFFAHLDRPFIMAALDFESKARQLNQPNGYKVNILGLQEDFPAGKLPQGISIWRRRFALLNHLGIRSDVLILRKAETIPPHGHYRVVSGFYVLQGQVAIRHYDRVREEGDAVLVRKVLDITLDPGGYTTNSEFRNNIHWLFGLAPVSYLFRVTVLGTPTETFGGPGRSGDRVYLDPTGAPDSNGLITAPYISADQAKKMPFQVQSLQHMLP
jgi:hypothetical protein